MFFFSFPKCRMCRISKRHVPTTTSVTKQTESQNRRTSSSCVRFFLHSFPVQVCLLLFHSFRPDPLPWFEDCRLRRKIKFYWSLLLHCDLLDLTKEDLLRRSGVDSTLISLVSCFGWWGDFGDVTVFSVIWFWSSSWKYSPQCRIGFQLEITIVSLERGCRLMGFTRYGVMYCLYICGLREIMYEQRLNSGG